jgi:hypothetical protein
MDAIGDEPGLTGVRAGQRVCGSPDCRAHLFVVRQYTGQLIVGYPVETIDFDACDIPARVVDAFEEAIACHAHRCFVSAAIMVRKTLEAVCADRGAEGRTLKDRIAALGEKVVLPVGMLQALDDLRARQVPSQDRRRKGSLHTRPGASRSARVRPRHMGRRDAHGSCRWAPRCRKGRRPEAWQRDAAV